MKLDWKLSSKLEKAGLKIAKFLQDQGFKAFWVGGVVRDNLLKKQSDNLDIATDATPDQVERILKENKIYNKPVGKQFGSILAIVDGQKIEIITFRKEARYSDKRHPDQVEFIKDFLDDAKRRDFTINAFYFDPIKKELYDPANGMKDLKGKLLRFVGDPRKRIDEDALRMLRGVRLATQLDFKLEKNSFAAIKTRAKYIQGVSGERIKAELDKILNSSNSEVGLRLLHQLGLLKFISLELDSLTKVFHKSKIYHLEGDGFTHALLVLKALKVNNLMLKYAALFHDVGKINTAKKVLKSEGSVNSFKGHEQESLDIFGKFATKLKFSRLETKIISWLIQHHDEKMDFYDMSEEQKVKFAFQPNFYLLLDLWQADLNGNLVNGTHNDWFRKPRFEAYTIGLKLLKVISKKTELIKQLANGKVIMKFSNL
jgi:tRNA nucleotidyltransferase (CCA-adding enzyme)